MELITKTPGLSHIADEIFLNLNDEILLLECQRVNQRWREIVRNPRFWFKKCDQMGLFKKKPEENLTKKSLFKDNDSKELMKKFFQAACTSGEKFKEELTKKLIKSYSKSKPVGDLLSSMFMEAIGEGQVEIIRATLPFIDDPNARVGDDRPIDLAVNKRQIDVLKLLFPLLDNPNSPTHYDCTPLEMAARYGLVDIVKFMAPLIKEPNAPNKSGWTPMHSAACGGHLEVVNILAPLTDNPNAPLQRCGTTPIHLATTYSHCQDLGRFY